jgi:calcium-activated chloride channel regulator 4
MDVMSASWDLSRVGRHQVYSLPGQKASDRERAKDPRFRYIEAAPPSFVLVLDQSSRMGGVRWASIKRALYRFIGLLPEGSNLSIVVYGETASMALPPTTVTEEKREGLHGRVPRRVLEQTLESPCLGCGLRLAATTLRMAGGNIVLVTREDGEVSEDLINEVTSSNIRLYTIAFPAFESTAITPLNSLSTYYRVKEASNPLSSLTDCLLDMLNRATSGNGQVQKLSLSHHAQHEFSGSFFVEEDLRTDIVVTLSIDDEQKIEFFEVSDPSGRKNIFSKFEDGLVLFRFPGESEPGVWSFRAKLYPDSALPLREMTVDVLARGKGEAVLVSSLSLQREGVAVVAATVTKGHRPVSGAEVVASVSGPGGSLDLLLQDSGLGYPDTTAGDGVYSAFLPTFSPLAGPLSVTIRATEGSGFTSPGGPEQDCCGSRLLHGRKDPTGKFSRYLAGPAILTSLVSPNSTDLSPPSRIPDLRVMATNQSRVTIRLTWTAPGGDYDQGQARGYLVGCHTDPSYLNETNFASKAILVHAAESLSAQAYGTAESLEAGVPWAGQRFYYGVVGVDTAGNRGPVSNLVAAFIEEATTTPLTTQPAPSLQREEGGGALVQKRDQVVLGAVLAGSLVVLVSLVVVWLVARRRRAPVGKAGEQGDTYQAGGYMPDPRSSKAREAEGCDGVYSWLETLPRSEGEGSSGGSPTGTVTEGDSVSDSPAEETAGELAHGYENFDAHAEAGAAPKPDKYASEIFNRSKQYFSVRGVAGSIVEAMADDSMSTRLGNSYMSMRPPDNPPMLPPPTCNMLPPPYIAFASAPRRKRHESVV